MQIFPIDAGDIESEPLNLMDLPVELRLDILEYLDINTLLLISKTIPDECNLIDTVFRNLYRIHAFVVYGYRGEVQILYRQIRVATIKSMDEDFKNFMEFLKKFGHYIKKFDFSFDSSVNRNLRESFRQQISKYVAEFVNEIDFRLDDQLTNEFNFTFPNAKIVKMSYSKIESTILRQMFPSVNSLDVNSNQMEESLDHFPQLERLSFPVYWAFDKLREFEQTLVANPQLKHLYISECRRWDILETLNKFRPDLKSLEFSDLIFYTRDIALLPIRFANMKVLKCAIYRGYKEGNIHHLPLEFGTNLEEIEFDRQELADFWVNVMMQNRNLRKITTQTTLSHDSLEQIAKLPNLEEITLSYDDTRHSNAQDIVDFLRNSNRLNKVIFIKLAMNDCKAAAQALKNEWNNSGNYWHCNFIRK